MSQSNQTIFGPAGDQSHGNPLDYAPKANRTWRNPTLAQGMLFALVLFASSVDLARYISFGGVSGLGALTLAAGGAVWAVWLLRPVLPEKLLGIFLPLIFFALDAVGTLLWYRPGMDGVQLLVVCLIFLGVMMLSARESSADPTLPRRLRTLLVGASAVPIATWTYLLVRGVVSVKDANLSRGFALYTLVVAAAALSIWREYSWPEQVRGETQFGRVGKAYSLWPLLWVGAILFVVLLGMSRTALIAAALLIPLSLLYRGNFKSAVLGTLMLAIGAGAFAIALSSYQPLYDRFFKEDASLHVGGVAINATGRTRIWNLLLSTLGDDWMFGKGISSSEDIINRTFPDVGQPHNDYLRFYYDQGALGLSLWLVFIAGFVYRTTANLRQSIKNRSPDYPYHLAALLALTAVSISMLTDNSYCYEFVMIPLGISMGSSLGLGRYYIRQQLALLDYPPPVEAFNGNP